MASQKAKQIDFLSAGLSDSSGQPRRGAKIYFYPSSSKTAPKEVYSDINKSQVLAQPVILGNSGEATVFGEGVYYIEAYDKNDVLIKTWDGYNYSSSVDFGGLYIDIGADYGTTGAAIQTAIDALNSNTNYAFLFQNSDFVISQDIIFPDNVVCHLWPTARFTIASSKDVKFEIDYVGTPGQEFFFGNGTVSFGEKCTKLNETLYYGGNHIIGDAYLKNIKMPVLDSSDAIISQSSERILRVDATSGEKTVNPVSAQSHKGMYYTVIKTDSSLNTVIVDPDGSETINWTIDTLGLSHQGDAVTLLYTDSGLEIISFHEPANLYIPYYSKIKFKPKESAATGASWTRVYQQEHGGGISWINNPLLKHKVKLNLRMSGGASNPSSVEARIQRYDGSTWTIVWQSHPFDVYNPGSSEYNDVMFDLHQDNVTDWDIYDKNVSGVNGGLENASHWKLEVQATGTAPEVYSMMYYWMK